MGLLAAFVLVLSSPVPAEAQLGSEARIMPQAKPRVFLDCQWPQCEFDYLRTHIPFVSWVHDRADADVHLIFTGQPAGGGGQRYTLDFIGLGELEGLNDQLTYTTHGSDVRAEYVAGVAHLMSMGLLRYAVQTGLARAFELGYTEPEGLSAAFGESEEPAAGAGPATAANYDPWDYWSFRFGMSGNLSVQERRSTRRLNPSFTANRTTDDWKLNLNIWANLTRQRIELSDGREVRNDVDAWRLNTLTVRSISDHVSIGLDLGASNSVPDNQKARIRLAPATEWNYYPYQEVTRRQLTAYYGAGLEYSNYEQETAFGVMNETLPIHWLAVQYRAREGWGNAGVGFNASQYLHEGGLYNIGFGGNLNLRVLRGLEFSVSASASRVYDQIHVPAAEIPDEEILLGRRALPTGYDYGASMGFTYRFGSVFTNVVNTRFSTSPH